MRILVVDDDSLTRFLLVHMLEEAGYTDCFEAECGREGIQLAEKLKPDLVLLDVLMPDMDGYEVAPILKKMSGDIYLPIIFITALDDQASLAKCLEVGGDDFAPKPFDRIILTAKIRAHSRTRLLSIKASQQNQELQYFRNGVEREHSIVEHIFSNALKINEKVANYFDYRLAPASSFNGDLFLTETSPSGGFYFLVGDFTGHGLASAIGALPVAKAFHAMAAKGVAIPEMAATINDTLLSLLPGDMFFAAIIGEVSSKGNQITIFNGGMPDIILVSPEGKLKKRFESMHMALGILDNIEFEDDSEHYEADIGDRFLGYSDGVIEITNAEEEMLGEEAVTKWFCETPNIPMSELSARLDAFRGNAEQLDDITLVSYICQDLEGLKPNNPISRLPFKIHSTMDTETLQQADPISDLVSMIASQKGIEGIRSHLSTILSELFNNSLDHGILGLNSSLKKSTDGFFDYFDQRMERLADLEYGEVKIDIEFDPLKKQLMLRIKDSGTGFDFENVQQSKDTDSFGRGIALVKELCSSLVYSEGGTHVCATFQL
ncbi:response regulator [Alteromonadaceae bacterium M269]|nr:response regulator [Alteromonadaceae bacterium M269]